MKKFAFLLFALFLFSGTAQAGEKIGVAVTVAPLAEFAEQVGGDLVSVIIIVPPGSSPHTYEPTPGQFRELSQAKLYAKVGSGIEFELAWLDKILAVNKHLAVCDTSRGIRPIGMAYHHHPEKKGEQHPHSTNDPHIWTSLSNATIMTGNIRDNLIALDPANAERYRSNADAYISRLRALKNRAEERLQNVRQRKFMVFHPSFGYFADEFNLIQIPVELDGKEPGAGTIASLIKKAREEKITVIFAQPQFNVKSAQTIARAIGGTVVMIDPLSRNYLQNMENVIQNIKDRLQ